MPTISPTAWLEVLRERRSVAWDWFAVPEVPEPPDSPAPPEPA